MTVEEKLAIAITQILELASQPNGTDPCEVEEKLGKATRDLINRLILIGCLELTVDRRLKIPTNKDNSKSAPGFLKEGR